MGTCLYILNGIAIFFAFYLLRTIRADNTEYLKRVHSLIKPYSDGRWEIAGNTIITSSYVRLTSDHQSKKGAIWNTAPCRVRHWELHVNFRVHGSGRDLFGDGLAIWYVKDRMEIGDVFGSKNFFHGLGIFLDTYNNHNGPHNHGHPYISAMIGNGSSGYDHDKDGTHTELAGCEAQFRNKNDDTHIAIRYESNTLTVSVDIDGKNSWKQCFTQTGIKLPTGYYFGASATTGELADNHDVISMKLFDVSSQKQDEEDKEDYSKIVPSAEFFAPPRDHVDDDKGGFMLSQLSGWKLLLLIFLSLIGITICAIVGFVIYSKRSEDNRKRFY